MWVLSFWLVLVSESRYSQEMRIEWDPKKAKSNLRKRKVSFEEAATAMSAPLAITGADPDHSVTEDRYIPLRSRFEDGYWRWLTPRNMRQFGSSAPVRRAKESESYMKKDRRTGKDELRTEYKRSDFPKGLVRGKYAERLRKSSNVVVLDPEVAQAFPNQEAVNSALRSLVQIAERTARPAGRSTGGGKKRRVG